MVNDPIGDLLIQIKNASLARKKTVELPYSKMKFAVAQILAQEGFIQELEKTGEAPKWMLRMKLKYDGDATAISDVKRISKPGLRVYIPHNKIPMVLGGIGVAVISTSAGIMTGKQAKKQKIGGELLCEIW